MDMRIGDSRAMIDVFIVLQLELKIEE